MNTPRAPGRREKNHKEVLDEIAGARPSLRRAKIRGSSVLAPIATKNTGGRWRLCKKHGSKRVLKKGRKLFVPAKSPDQFAA